MLDKFWNYKIFMKPMLIMANHFNLYASCA